MPQSKLCGIALIVGRLEKAEASFGELDPVRLKFVREGKAALCAAVQDLADFKTKKSRAPASWTAERQFRFL